LVKNEESKGEKTMKMKLVIPCAAALLLAAATAARAGDDSSSNWWTEHFGNHGDDSAKYRKVELSLDFFGSYINREQKFQNVFSHDIDGGSWGGGVGLNFFFLKYLGIGGDINLSDHSGQIVDEVSGNLIFRLPIGNTGLSPYVFGGGGRFYNPVHEWMYGGGGGLEFRFSKTIGIFSDARFLWSEATTQRDRLLVRAGLRIAF
jgi:hypothetical protein